MSTSLLWGCADDIDEDGGAKGEGGGGSRGTALVRLANMSPDAPPPGNMSPDPHDFDLCFIGDSITLGPALSTAGGFGLGDFFYTGVTSYVKIPAGTYSIRVVASDATNCDTALDGVSDIAGVELANGSNYTIAALGRFDTSDGAKPFQIKTFVDASLPNPEGKGRVTFIHASAYAPNMDVELLDETGVVAQRFDDVAFATEKTVEVDVDLSRYFSVRMRVAGETTDPLVIDGIGLSEGEVLNLFALSNIRDDARPLQLAFCTYKYSDTGVSYQTCTPKPL